MIKFQRAIARGAMLMVGAGACLATAAAADAASPYDRFAHCPYNDPTVITCIYSETNTGSFVLGSKNVPIDQPIVLQGALNTARTWVNPVGAPAMSEPELNVPGGILGVPGWDGPLLGVKSIAKLRGTPVLSVANYALQTGVAMELPIRVQLKNPMLSNDCSIGSTSDPMTLKLTTGTTAPPAPNSPITGTRGTVANEEGGRILRYVTNSLVDNSFAAPKAKWCDLFGTSTLITAAVNASVGLPAAAGKNTAVLGGTLWMSSAANVRAALGS